MHGPNQTPPQGQIPGPKFTLSTLLQWVGAWSGQTFGPPETRGPVGPLKHLAKEAAEAAEAWQRVLAIAPDGLISATPERIEVARAFLEELADCQILVFDALYRCQVHPADFLAIAQMKMSKNIARQWPPPTPDEPVEHVRDEKTIAPGVGPEAMTLAKLESELARWHQEKYGRTHVIPHETLCKLFEELGEFGEAVRSAQRSTEGGFVDDVAIEAFDVISVVLHLVRNFGGSVAAQAPRKLAVIFDRLKPQPAIDGESNHEIGGGI